MTQLPWTGILVLCLPICNCGRDAIGTFIENAWSNYTVPQSTVERWVTAVEHPKVKLFQLTLTEKGKLRVSGPVIEKPDDGPMVTYYSVELDRMTIQIIYTIEGKKEIVHHNITSQNYELAFITLCNTYCETMHDLIHDVKKGLNLNIRSQVGDQAGKVLQMIRELALHAISDAISLNMKQLNSFLCKRMGDKLKLAQWN